MSFINFTYLPLTRDELEILLLTLDYFRCVNPIPKPHLDSGLVETVFHKCVALELANIEKRRKS